MPGVGGRVHGTWQTPPVAAATELIRSVALGDLDQMSGWGTRSRAEDTEVGRLERSLPTVLGVRLMIYSPPRLFLNLPNPENNR